MTLPMTSEGKRPADGWKVEGRHVLFGLLAFFATVTSVNLYMAYSAISTYSGRDAPNAYRAGLDYNTRIAAEARQAALGWSDDFEWTATSEPLRFKLTDRRGEPVTGLHVTARVARAVTNRFDRAVVMSERAPGTYAVNVGDTAIGNWVVEITAAKVKGGEHAIVYEARRRVWLKQ